MKRKINLLDKTPRQTEAFMKELKEPSYRARQIMRWIYEKKVRSFDEMINIPRGLISRLKKEAYFDPLKKVAKERAKDGTVKFLLELQDSSRIETVFIPHSGARRSLCISTQDGCSMGCIFCATAKVPFRRNLTCGEMVNQILTAEKDLNIRITNAVFMGMGEPLLNYANLLKAINIISHNKGLNISMRRITVSTCGIVPGIYGLAREKLQLTLAISLNAATGDLRDSLMPINKKYPIVDLMNAADHYSAETGRRISFEYVLIKNVNDTQLQASALASLLKGKLAHVNLIPHNPLRKEEMKPASSKSVEIFSGILKKEGIPFSVRKKRGVDIHAACGQLKGGE